MCNYIVLSYAVNLGVVPLDVLREAMEILRSAGLRVSKSPVGWIVSPPNLMVDAIVRESGIEVYSNRYVDRRVSETLGNAVRDAILAAAAAKVLREMGFHVEVSMSYETESYSISLVATRADGGSLIMRVEGGKATLETSNFGPGCVPLTRELIERVGQLGVEVQITEEVLKEEALGYDDYTQSYTYDQNRIFLG